MAFSLSLALQSEHLPLGVSLIQLAAICLVLAILLRIIQNVCSHPLKAVPGPLLAKISSISIRLDDLKGIRSHTLLDLHEKYGPYVRVGPNEVSISDPEMYRKIYTQGASVKEDSFYSSTRLTPPNENIFSMRNKAQHAARRKMENHPYSLQAINQHEPVIRNKADIFLERIISEAAASSSNTVDVYPLCGLFSLEIICQVAFNNDINAESTTPGLNFLHAMSQAAIIAPLTNTFPLLAHTKLSESFPGVIGKAFTQRRQWEETTRAIYTSFRRDSEQTGQDGKDKFLASPFVHKVDDFLGRRLTEDEGLEEAMGLCFAGSGTTSTTIAYILYHLSRPENRAMQRRLREELCSPNWSTASVTDLPYLNAVIKETMRLNPSLMGTLPRILTTTVVADTDDDHVQAGIKSKPLVFPPGTRIAMQNYVHHRNPKVYPDPHSFNPDRWLGITGSSTSSAVEKAFTPYSLGPRNCIGQNLANLELRIATALLFSNLDFRLHPTMKEEDMEMEDRFAALVRGGKLLLDVERLSPPASDFAN